MTSRILLLGCGAVGSHLAMFLAAPGQHWTLIDDDRVAADNILTSAYSTEHIGILKAHALEEMLVRKCDSIQVDAIARRLTQDTFVIPAGMHVNPSAIIDCFDNAESRRILRGLQSLHVGVSPERIGVVHWEGVFQHGEEGESSGPHICTHQLGQQIIQLTAAVAAGVVRRYFTDGTRRSVTVSERLRIL